jgi:hypothetical protein
MQSAGAKSWLLYLAYEWMTSHQYGEDTDTVVEKIVAFLAHGQDIDLPKGRRAGVWTEARSYATECQIKAGGFKAANKEAHDNVLLGYTLAWLYFTGQIDRPKGNSNFRAWVDSCYPVMYDHKGHPVTSPSGILVRNKTAIWPAAGK